MDEMVKWCPLCGGSIMLNCFESRDGTESYRVSCDTCGAGMLLPKERTRVAAISLWNALVRSRDADWLPIPLEELKTMEGEPVWTERQPYKNSKSEGKWRIFGGYEWCQGHITDWISLEGLGRFPCDEYGTTISCYRQRRKGATP